MIEFIVIVESGADARIATKLAERILRKQFDWLDDDSLQYYFKWTGLEEGREYSCWRDIKKIIDDAKQQLKYQDLRKIMKKRTTKNAKDTKERGLQRVIA
ncbi:hypothetical protein [Nodularia spumigena]|uniref:Uncharacterized protein n=1 Tax=Nodularia spumigena UHCC 0060 TaxID=3110300 RepID=A0ABU5USM2_NODSP|nr:hypothetical protein [Nodularia spumigena]MEA5609298.1 hypothetical protein [Nodularia spumigena UHCC 0060]MEA5614787.1 hypothetical protein [Nodularia spumigena UHCC 0040]